MDVAKEPANARPVKPPIKEAPASSGAAAAKAALPAKPATAGAA